MMTPAIAPRRALTLIELMVALTIVAILATLLLPLLGAARSAALRVSCASNLRQLGMGTLAYIADHDDALPEGGAWNDANSGCNWWNSPQAVAIMGYLDAEPDEDTRVSRLTRCPANPKGNVYSFWPGRPSDHRLTLHRLESFAGRQQLPGLSAALWTDHCYLYDWGTGRNFDNACGHRGQRTAPLCGIPKGGNIGLTNGAVVWSRFVGDGESTGIDWVFNGGSIGGQRALPSCAV